MHLSPQNQFLKCWLFKLNSLPNSIKIILSTALQSLIIKFCNKIKKKPYKFISQKKCCHLKNNCTFYEIQTCNSIIWCLE